MEADDASKIKKPKYTYRILERKPLGENTGTKKDMKG
jgi:hypothetical protein